MAKPEPFPEIAVEIAEIVDWKTLGIPAKHSAYSYFKTLDRGLKLSSRSSVELVMSVMVDLCIYSRLDRAIRVALALQPIGRGAGVPFNGITAGMSVVSCFADRAKAPRAKAVREATLFPGGQPETRLPRRLDGSTFNNLFDQTEHDHNTYVGWAMEDIRRLADMWVFGSPKLKWNKRRIGKEIDRNVAGILALPNWGPWDAE